MNIFKWILEWLFGAKEYPKPVVKPNPDPVEQPKPPIVVPFPNPEPLPPAAWKDDNSWQDEEKYVSL